MGRPKKIKEEQQTPQQEIKRCTEEPQVLYKLNEDPIEPSYKNIEVIASDGIRGLIEKAQREGITPDRFLQVLAGQGSVYLFYKD